MECRDCGHRDETPASLGRSIPPAVQVVNSARGHLGPTPLSQGVVFCYKKRTGPFVMSRPYSGLVLWAADPGDTVATQRSERPLRSKTWEPRSPEKVGERLGAKNVGCVPRSATARSNLRASFAACVANSVRFRTGVSSAISGALIACQRMSLRLCHAHATRQVVLMFPICGA